MPTHHKAYERIVAAVIVVALMVSCGKTGPTETDASSISSLSPTNMPVPLMDTPIDEASSAVTPLPSRSGDDGGQIAFYSTRDGNPEIYVINADGTGLQRLTANSAGDMAPAWSPDGTQIAFTSNRDGNNEIYVMNADGSDQCRLTDNSAYESHPDWSPDGTRIAFVSERDGNREIYTMNADGANSQRLTDNPADDMRPDWSPDGTQILFNSERDGNWEIYVINSDGSALRRLTNSPTWEVFPTWSPDGTQIAYRCSSAREWNGDVCVMNVDGSAERTLTSHTGNDENPIWSPDGTHIVFQSDRYADPQTANTDNYNFEILVMDADGNNVRRLTDSPTGDYWPTWWSMTTDVLTAALIPSLGDTWIRPANGMEMVYVPAGTFQMGSTDAEIGVISSQCEHRLIDRVYCERGFYEYESPQHSVTLDGFWIDRTEVTNAQYTLCVEDGDCRQPRLANNPIYNGDDFPVAGIPWQDAADYCAWAGGRLPTEAEWEYAARGTEGHIYPWGDAFDCAGGNFGDDFTECDDGHINTAPVGSFPDGVSWCGALDMAGNVWEWVSDKFGDYVSAVQINPIGPTVGELYVLRGGSWGYGWEGVRTAYRYPVPPSADYLGVGFRCVTLSKNGPSE